MVSNAKSSSKDHQGQFLQHVRPMWTEKMYLTVGGQDHLGIGSVVTDKILPLLSPGINVLTPRPRYWSFYAFVIDEFWKRDLPRTGPSFRRFMRQKESIFSAAGHFCSNPEHGAMPIGSRRVGPLVAENKKSYSTNFDYMKSSGGGYGLYYATAMQATGVVRLADKELGLPVDAVTPVLGVEVAESFRNAISGTKYWQKYFDQDEIPSGVVEELAEVCCLCRLRNNAPDRRPLVKVFLNGGHESEVQSRQNSLRLMLELAKQTSDVSISEADFRRLMLYGSAYDVETDEETATFVPPDDLISTARRWRISQLREFFNWSLNGMWQWMNIWGLALGGDSIPISLADLKNDLRRVSFKAVPGMKTKSNQPIGLFIDECERLAGMTGSLDGSWDLWAGVTEDHLINLVQSEALNSDEMLGALFALYVMCLTRLRSHELPTNVGQEDWRLLMEGGQSRIGLQFALDQLRRDEAAGKTVLEVMQRVIDNHVIAQHERVALSKLPADTFRFRRHGSRLEFFAQPHQYRMNASRFESLSTICSELGWCGVFSKPGHKLTKEGEQIRKFGKIESGILSG